MNYAVYVFGVSVRQFYTVLGVSMNNIFFKIIHRPDRVISRHHDQIGGVKVYTHTGRTERIKKFLQYLGSFRSGLHGKMRAD